jgi:hypothetical protein
MKSVCPVTRKCIHPRRRSFPSRDWQNLSLLFNVRRFRFFNHLALMKCRMRDLLSCCSESFQENELFSVFESSRLTKAIQNECLVSFVESSQTDVKRQSNPDRCLSAARFLNRMWNNWRQDALSLFLNDFVTFDFSSE